jgi:hypothetical protein
VVESCKHGGRPEGFIKGGKFLDCLKDYYFLNKDISLRGNYNAVK